MSGRCTHPARPARSGMTLIELMLALAALGLLGCLLLFSRPEIPSPVDSAVLSCPEAVPLPPPPPPPRPPVYGEMSLQQTLDRLGYTVNVPRFFHGIRVASLGYRTSSRDDSIDAGWFRCVRPVALQEISQQALLRRVTLSAVSADDRTTTTELLGSNDQMSGPGDEQMSDPVTWNSAQVVRFVQNYGRNSFNSGRISSVAKENPHGMPQLIVLPARKNGYWVNEVSNTGHWEGGENSGDFLLCWEDWSSRTDGDYQDLVIRARGIVPIAGRGDSGEMDR
jgi:prepilin-type N-terminal cleavage/methylation domain-containing protein